MQGIESGTWQSIVLLESSLFLYQCDFSFFCRNQELLYIRQNGKLTMQSSIKTHKTKRRVKPIATLREKDSFKLEGKRCKTRVQNCQQQETKGSPRASAGRVIGPPGEELPPEDLPGKKP